MGVRKVMRNGKMIRRRIRKRKMMRNTTTTTTISMRMILTLTPSTARDAVEAVAEGRAGVQGKGEDDPAGRTLGEEDGLG